MAFKKSKYYTELPGKGKTRRGDIENNGILNAIGSITNSDELLEKIRSGQKIPDNVDPAIIEDLKLKAQTNSEIKKDVDNAISSGLMMIPGWGTIAGLAVKAGSFLGDTISNKDEFGIANSDASAIASDLFNPTAGISRGFTKIKEDGFQVDDLAYALPFVGGIKERNDAIKAKTNAEKINSINVNVAQQKVSNDYFKNMYSQSLKDGGKVKGKGTAKSDSISTSLDPNSFIVPSENASIAMQLGKKYLGWNNEQKSDKGGNTKVNLSDGEVVFQPDEVMALKGLGIDLNSLAPNAEGGSKLSKGGPPDENDIESNKQHIAKIAKELGLSTNEFVAIILQESSGDPKKIGGDGNNFEGLIQWGKEEREKELPIIAKKNGIKYNGNIKEVSFKDQLTLAKDWVISRGFKPGKMNNQQLYATILGGDPTSNSKDSNGTQANNNPNIDPGGKFYKQAEKYKFKPAEETQQDRDNALFNGEYDSKPLNRNVLNNKKERSYNTAERAEVNFGKNLLNLPELAWTKPGEIINDIFFSGGDGNQPGIAERRNAPIESSVPFKGNQILNKMKEQGYVPSNENATIGEQLEEIAIKYKNDNQLFKEDFPDVDSNLFRIASMLNRQYPKGITSEEEQLQIAESISNKNKSPYEDSELNFKEIVNQSNQKFSIPESTEYTNKENGSNQRRSKLITAETPISEEEIKNIEKEIDRGSLFEGGSDSVGSISKDLFKTAQSGIDRNIPIGELKLPINKTDLVNKENVPPPDESNMPGINWGTALGLGQSAMGLWKLSQQGDRPEDKISPEFEAYMGGLRNAEPIGYTGEQYQTAINQVENVRMNDLGSIKELVGGDAGLAMASINESGRRATEGRTKVAFDDATLMNQDRMSIRNQRANAEFFGENRRAQIIKSQMDEFDSNQAAYANLLNAGISNVIGSQDPLYKKYQNEYRNKA